MQVDLHSLVNAQKVLYSSMPGALPKSPEDAAGQPVPTKLHISSSAPDPLGSSSKPSSTVVQSEAQDNIGHSNIWAHQASPRAAS
ncbi:hypothetical protein WJX84_011000 [Apatococcus fuscideae]|uniref:Uncharacterized protein n=1 Tax=Apatococcus fuscideae TaxID=2026836 RepID=A0AAW1T6U1_9CHLO